MMNEWINDELLSAYLDGEVTAEEQAQIEELLAAQPQVRQLLDELRALSGALQSLPPARLETDLSERVIRAAQRQILTGGEAATESTSSAGSLWTQLRKRLTGRAVFWPAVAAALALWIVLTDLGRVGDAPSQREVVRAPAPELTAMDDSSSVGLKSKTMGGDVAAGGMGFNRFPTGVRADAASVGKPGDTASSEVAATGAADGAVPSPKPAGIGPAGSGDEGARRKLRENERWDVASATAKPQGGAAEPGGPMAYRDSSNGDVRAADRPDNRRFSALRNAGDSAQAGGGTVPPVATGTAARLMADAPATDDGETTRTAEGESGRHRGLAPVKSTTETAAEESAAAEDGILVVHVDIAADAARNDLFGQLLAQNSILWEPDPAAVGGSGWYSVDSQIGSADLEKRLAGKGAVSVGPDSNLRTQAQRAEQKVGLLDGAAQGASVPQARKSQALRNGFDRPTALRTLAGPAEGNNSPEALAAAAAPKNIADDLGKPPRCADAPPAAGATEEAEQLPKVPSAADPSGIARSEKQSRSLDTDTLARRALKAPPSPEIELVYVEAQASQIQNLIADLARAPQSVVSVAVEPARGSQHFADRQQMPIASQLARGKSAPPTVLRSDSLAFSAGAAREQTDKMPLSPEDAPAGNSPMVPVERPSRASPGWDGRSAETGPASGALGGGVGAAPAGEESELLARTADRAESARRGAVQQADRLRQDNAMASEAPAGQGGAGGQGVFGRAHRVARLDNQNQAVGQTLQDEIAAARQTSSKAADVEPAQPKPWQSSPGAGGEQPRNGSRQAVVKREADHDPKAVPEGAIDGVDGAEKANQRDDGFGRDSSLAQSHAQAALPQAARQQRVLFVLRTVPSVQTPAARLPMAAPADTAAEADAASDGNHPDSQGEPHRGMLPAAPVPAEPSRQ